MATSVPLVTISYLDTSAAMKLVSTSHNPTR